MTWATTDYEPPLAFPRVGRAIDDVVACQRIYDEIVADAVRPEFDVTRPLTVNGRSYFLGILTGMFLVMLGMTVHGEHASFPDYPIVTIALGAVLAIAWLFGHDPLAGDPAGADQ